MRKILRRKSAVSSVVSLLLAVVIVMSSVGTVIFITNDFLTDQRSVASAKSVADQFSTMVDSLDEMSKGEAGDSTLIPVSTSEGSLDTVISSPSTVDKPVSDPAQAASETSNMRNILWYATQSGFDISIEGLDDSDNLLKVFANGGEGLTEAVCYWLKKGYPPEITDWSGDVEVTVEDTVVLWVTAVDDIRIKNATVTIDDSLVYNMSWNGTSARWEYNYTTNVEVNHTYYVTVYDDSLYDDTEGPGTITVNPEEKSGSGGETFYSGNRTLVFTDYENMIASTTTLFAHPGDDFTDHDHATIVFHGGGRETTEIPMPWDSGSGSGEWATIPGYKFTYTLPPGKPPVADIDFAEITIIAGAGSVAVSVLANDYDPNGAGEIDIGTLEITVDPLGGTAEVDGNKIVYTASKWNMVLPMRDFDNFSYTVKDKMGATSNEATVYIYRTGKLGDLMASLLYTYNPMMECPVVANDDFIFLNDTIRATGLVFDSDMLLANDLPEGGGGQCYVVSLPRYSDFSSVESAECTTFTYNPTEDFGPDIATYSAFKPGVGYSYPGAIILAGDEEYHINVYDSGNNLIAQSETYWIHYNRKPVADAGGPYSGMEYSTVQFDGSNSIDYDGSIAEYSWSFGDGSHSNQMSPSHVYTDDGVYNVNLRVIDDEGYYSSYSYTTATISEPSNPPNFNWFSAVISGEDEIKTCDPNGCINNEVYTATVVDTKNYGPPYTIEWYVDGIFQYSELGLPSQSQFVWTMSGVCDAGMHEIKFHVTASGEQAWASKCIKFLKGVIPTIDIIGTEYIQPVYLGANTVVPLVISGTGTGYVFHYTTESHAITFKALYNHNCVVGTPYFSWKIGSNDWTSYSTQDTYTTTIPLGGPPGNGIYTVEIHCKIKDDTHEPTENIDPFYLNFKYGNANGLPKIVDIQPEIRNQMGSKGNLMIDHYVFTVSTAGGYGEMHFIEHGGNYGPSMQVLLKQGDDIISQAAKYYDVCYGGDLSTCKYLETWDIEYCDQELGYVSGPGGSGCPILGFYYKGYRWLPTSNGHSYYLKVTVRDKAGSSGKFPQDYLNGAPYTSDAYMAFVDITDGTCFLENTSVLMADDSYKNIEDIKTGDKVKAYDFETNTLVSCNVNKLFSHTAEEMTYDYYLVLNNDLRVTPNHRFYINDEWIEADELQIGDVFFDSNRNTEYQITSIEKIYEKQPSYDLEVQGCHNYFVKINDYDVLVHNDGSFDELAPGDVYHMETLTIDDLGGGYYDLSAPEGWPFTGTVVIFLKDNSGVFGKIWIFDYDRPVFTTSDGESVTMINDAIIQTGSDGSSNVQPIADNINDETGLLSLRIIQMKGIESFATSGRSNIRIEAVLNQRMLREKSRDVYSFYWRIVDEEKYAEPLRNYYTNNHNFQELAGDPKTLFYDGSAGGVKLSFTHTMIRFMFRT